ncbi:MAG: prepilin-type N-terminal cleavage/methylation domain-containing protein [Levilactobacillus sp.]|jgi:competence protein ComGF|uniref:prepilin-type N-terminal cleavage/methylation domain-containing protein n=1 Tax=Levilactobacillus sp. TaxID=2767919 RepID=UPI00258C9373|nr:prepilin-type N-terminal cleavage/methylation domain-containing protein [Levilactobacillus sp.]MCH4124383.1 prepilin-type N-terminal cleavage/methylation domain-containing protein [Levilactobacillus sp.]MCI1554577.1 prepilin-type N-terminal cleavage/methylation domain-containing protein [Levilactobacillus sp.]MCI1599742.1 prepilin-type N-terminal cleavage/methylation domain-containing protein [Levilactobacillus sp.]MCI1606436.1 prepilin-type N-terminal cleavage/methylation domain-containing 
MRPRQGFTLIETVLALVIAAGMFVLVSGLNRAFLRPIERDPIAWYQVVRALEQDGRYRLVRTSDDVLVVRDQRDDHEAVLRVDARGTLKITNAHQRGYYPLLRHVTAIHWQTLKLGVVRLELKQAGLPAQTTLVDLRGIRGS